MARTKGAKTAPKKMCQTCQKPKSIRSFYRSTSNLSTDGLMGICKGCLRDMVDVDDINSVKSVLRQIDKPFVESVWQTSVESDDNTFGNYIKTINSLPQYKNTTWQDFDKNIQNLQENTNKVIDIPEVDFEVTRDILLRWGSNYTPEQYLYLENQWAEYNRSYEIETASHKDYTIKIIKLSLAIDEAERNNDHKLMAQLIPVYDKLQHSAKFTAVQRTASDRVGGMNTFGEWFALVEKDGFIPKFHTDEPMDVVDETMEEYKKYVRELVLGDTTIPQLVEAQMQKYAEKGDFFDDEAEVLDDSTDVEDTDNLDDTQLDEDDY